MSEMTVGMKLQAHAEQAQAELKAVADDLAQLGRSAATAGTKGKAGLDEVTRAGRRTETEMESLGAAATRARASVATITPATHALGRANAAAAGQVGNLAAQFNDIGTMMAAGQSPLQLALQQGTQITQVIGPMGAAGAVRALGTAFVSIFSPINIITIGAIAAAAAFTQWLTSAGDQAGTLADRIDTLSKSVDAVKSATRDALTPMADLRREFGENAQAARDAYDTLLAIKQMQFADVLAKAQTSMVGQFDGLTQMMERFNRITKYGNISPEITVAAARRVIKEIQHEYSLTIIQATRVENALEALGKASGPQEAEDAARKLREALQATADESGNIPKGLREAVEAAAQLQLKAAALAGSLGRSGDETRKLGDTDPSGGIDKAAARAEDLAKRLGVSLGLARQLAALDYRTPNESRVAKGIRSGAIPNVPSAHAAAGDIVSPVFKVPPKVVLPPMPVTPSHDGGGGGGGAATHLKALSEAAQRAQGLLAQVARQSVSYADVVRELSGQLNAGKITQAQFNDAVALADTQMNHTAKSASSFGDTLGGMFASAIQGAHSFKDAIKNLLSSLSSLLLNNAFKMLFSGIGGGKGGGGFVAKLLGAADGAAFEGGVQKFAAGGIVASPTLFGMRGGMGLMGEAGPEAIMPLTRGADGKLGVRAQGGAQQVHISVSVNGARGNAEVQQMVYEGVSQGLDAFSRLVMPGRVKHIISDPRAVG